MEPHIRSQFDRDLEAIQAQLVRMGQMVQSNLVDAAEALDQFDLDRAAAMITADKAVDELHDLINTDCARVIALRAPTAGDLRVVLACMRTANNLERVGDYAKNVAKRTRVLADQRRLDGATGTIRRMSKVVARMLDDALEAFVRRDADAAAKVRASDIDVDQIYNTLFRALITHMLEDPGNITTAMHLHFIAKNIERAGDHATSVAEQAIYLVTGQMPEDERPKAGVPTV
jgi:phosphate transport system protein